MAKDIAPELWEQIERSFDSALSIDPVARSLKIRLENGKATSEDVFRYVERLGKIASKSLKMYLVIEDMPDERLYWNIVERTVRPLLEKVHRLINESAAQELELRNAESGVNIKAVESPFPEDRVKALLDKLSRVGEVRE